MKCTDCALQARPNRRTCTACGEWRAQWHQKRRQKLRRQGLCVVCKKPHSTGLERCRVCTNKHNKKQRDRHAKRSSTGCCLHCSAASSAGLFCLAHWFQRKAKDHGLNKRETEALRRLWLRQKGRCFYTGAVLVPGVNTSLDHKTPKAKGGTNDPSNLCWCLTAVNLAKRDLSARAFLALCRRVLRHTALKQNRHYTDPPAGNTPSG